MTAPANTIADKYRAIHDRISAFLAEQDGASFREDVWNYERGSGGGVTRVWENSALIEKGGVNCSLLHS